MSEANTAPGSCTACGTDLLLTPYSRDKKGRAFCKSCVTKLKQKQAAQAQARTTSSAGGAPLAVVEPGDHDVMAALLADSAQVTKRPCPDCQAFIDPEASICIYCGYNSKTGKRVSTRVIAAAKDKEPSAVGTVASGLAGSVWWVPSLLCGLIGAMIGAAIWYGIGIAINFEIGYVAALVGFLAGGGCYLGARGNAGIMTGVMAAALAVGGIGVAKWAFVEDGYNDMVGTSVNDQFAIDMIAHSLVEEAGTRTVAVPTFGRRGRGGVAGGQFNRLSFSDAQTMAESIWQKEYSPLEQQEVISEIRTWQNEMRQDSAQVKQDLFTNSLHMFDLIFIVFAVVAALGVGSGGQFSLGDD
jgi:hypothetical protein